jgi:hypothetical protein
MTDPVPVPNAAAPDLVVWECQTCGRQQTGPMTLGYAPVCPLDDGQMVALPPSSSTTARGASS